MWHNSVKRLRKNVWTALQPYLGYDEPRDTMCVSKQGLARGQSPFLHSFISRALTRKSGKSHDAHTF